MNVESIRQFIYREADCLDRHLWDEWLGLYHQDVEYWVPAWNGEHEITGDPANELSLIYYNGKWGLEDRVYRLRTERSSASTPLPRTCHIVSNITCNSDEGEGQRVSARWVCHQFRQREGESLSFFGRYEYVLAPVETTDGWVITSKKTIVMNDKIPSVMDFFMI